VRVVVVVVALAGCRSVLGIDQAIGIDAASDRAVDSSLDAPATGSACLGSAAELAVCVPLPQPARTLSSVTLTTAFASGDPPDCDFVQSVGSGSDVCVVAGGTLTIDDVAVRDERGRRPMVFVATESITVTGVLDAGSHRLEAFGPGALTGTCIDNGNGLRGATGGGGGAGGSYGDAGGSGGAGAGGSGGAAGLPRLSGGIQAGCPGGDGESGTAIDVPGGASGGVVYLIAPTIDVVGTIDVSGEGGTGGSELSGGGGGGTGGMCGLDATALAIGGLVVAHGGGGGGASGTAGSVAAQGMNGTDAVGTTGSGGLGGGTGGDGGNGATDLVAAQAGRPVEAGSASSGSGSGSGSAATEGGGGGGGGGRGVVWLVDGAGSADQTHLGAVVVVKP
jgi:hypothetical protein